MLFFPQPHAGDTRPPAPAPVTRTDPAPTAPAPSAPAPTGPPPSGPAPTGSTPTERELYLEYLKKRSDELGKQIRAMSAQTGQPAPGVSY